jgi:hypothetical protein
LKFNLQSQHPQCSGEPWPPGLELSNRIGAAFGEYDSDMSGTLEVEEVIAAFKDINLTSVSVHDIKKKFVEFDADNSGGRGLHSSTFQLNLSRVCH